MPKHTDSSPGLLEGSKIRVGQYVSYAATTDYLPELNNSENFPKFLYMGHPGRISDASPMHVLVDWYGFDDTYVNFALGFSIIKEDGPVIGISPISAQEYDIRCEEVARGERPSFGI